MKAWPIPVMNRLMVLEISLFEHHWVFWLWNRNGKGKMTWPVPASCAFNEWVMIMHESMSNSHVKWVDGSWDICVWALRLKNRNGECKMTWQVTAYCMLNEWVMIMHESAANVHGKWVGGLVDYISLMQWMQMWAGKIWEQRRQNQIRRRTMSCTTSCNARKELTTRWNVVNIASRSVLGNLESIV